MARLQGQYILKREKPRTKIDVDAEDCESSKGSETRPRRRRNQKGKSPRGPEGPGGTSPPRLRPFRDVRRWGQA